MMPGSISVPVPYSTFSDVAGWWRADTFTGSAGGYSITDLSANGNAMLQQAGTLTPGTGVNSKAKFTGNAAAYLNSNLAIRNWPCTIITIAVRANNATCGFFGHSGSNPTATLWTGYEASNQNSTYNNNRTNNTTSEAGSITAYGTWIGWGSRVVTMNGLIQTDHPLATTTQSSPISTSLGTQYRGFNSDWYETLVWNRCLSLSDLDEVYTYINTRYGMSIPLWSSYTGVNVIFVWGQSNAAGRGIKAALNPPYSGAQTNVFVWTNVADYTSTAGSSWATLDESAFNNDLGDAQGNLYYGYEASLPQNYINRVGGSVYLFKFAQGNTYLNNQGGALPFWDAVDNTVSQNASVRLYQGFMTNWVNALINFQTNSKRPIGKVIIGTHGENDAINSTAAGNYQTNLINFYQTIVPELRVGTSLPIIITRLPNGQDPANETSLSTVQTAQTNAAATLPNCTLFNTDSYAFNSGSGPHWSNAAYIQIGIDLAALIN